MSMRRLAAMCFTLAVGSLVLPTLTRGEDAAAPAKPPINFEDDVVPILQVRCLKCHGEEARKGGLDLRRKFTMIQGGDGGPALAPGRPEESLLIEMISNKEMPPKEEEPLDARQIEVLKRWVTAGAPIKGEAEPPLETSDQETPLNEEDRRFWSFQPPIAGPLPEVNGLDQVRTPIDAFLLARLEAQGLAFNPDASKSTLLRRLCFDLLGLPPSPEQLDAFLADERDGAYERLVEQLLESPQYGERWARHWLDVAGYSDSDGGLDADRERPEAWRYRDYVIRALNDDKPYDQFVREQLAGDELTDWRRAPEITPEVADQLVATGFLRTAVDPTYPGYKEKPEIYKVLADTMQIVGSAFLGVTIQCARCHEHKLEPISQRDYYQLSAIFAPALDPERWLASSERIIPLATEAQQAVIAARNEGIKRRVGELTQHLTEIRSRLRREVVDQRLPLAFQETREEFRGPELPAGWGVKREGAATGWKYTVGGDELQIQDIEGKPTGYATIRLTRPAALAGDFQTECRFRWHSADTAPENNTAMQVLLVNLRDAAGNIVVSQGYVDENNSRRGTAVGGIGVGPDLIAHNLAKYQQVAPPDEFAHALSPAGAATITIRRDAEGKITTTHDDGKVRTGVAGQSTATVAEIEIELRRFILPGATFEGLAIDRLVVSPGAGSAVDQETQNRLRDALLAEDSARSEKQKKLLQEKGPRLAISDDDLRAWAAARHPELLKDSERLTAAIAAEQSLVQSIPPLRGILDLDDTPVETRVLRRGDFNNKGRVVTPGVPAVLVASDFHFQPLAGYKTSGRRKALAEWLTDPRHPTTARLHVNRVWAGHFGRGLVETLDDFGHSGKLPTHPELLDWLASEFIRRGWSQKALHRLIVTSTAYRQSSAFDPAKGAVDGENSLLWAYRPQRHQGETLRDSVLALAGKLNPKMFGAATPVALQGDGSVITADNDAGNRRSIYLQVRRSQPVTLMEAFDTPKMEVNCARRSEAIVATQALTLMNSPFMESSAHRLAERIVQGASDRGGRVNLAWKLLYTRVPTESERRWVEEFLDQYVSLHLGTKLTTATPQERHEAEAPAWPHLTLTLLNTNEFLFVD
ncbi:MAG: PSD1 and planctomycete cytochrome C domain-containing protein [Planctomycetales bacterium]